jgi:hypothetical protein
MELKHLKKKIKITLGISVTLYYSSIVSFLTIEKTLVSPPSIITSTLTILASLVFFYSLVLHHKLTALRFVHYSKVRSYFKYLALYLVPLTNLYYLYLTIWQKKVYSPREMRRILFKATLKIHLVLLILTMVFHQAPYKNVNKAMGNGHLNYGFNVLTSVKYNMSPSFRSIYNGILESYLLFNLNLKIKAIPCSNNNILFYQPKLLDYESDYLRSNTYIILDVATVAIKTFKCLDKKDFNSRYKSIYTLAKHTYMSSNSIHNDKNFGVEHPYLNFMGNIEVFFIRLALNTISNKYENTASFKVEALLRSVLKHEDTTDEQSENIQALLDKFEKIRL